MIAKILVVLAALVVVFLIIAALQPAGYRVERSIMISASPAIAFNQVNDLHRWQEMSPYEKLDPAMRHTYSGPSAGEGASTAWTGNSQVGEGRMTITESRPNELVRMRLDFEKPFRSVCVAEFTFIPMGEQTKASWSMTGQKAFVMKAMGLVMNMDKMIGGQFDEGLANLRSLAEAAAKK